MKNKLVKEYENGLVEIKKYKEKIKSKIDEIINENIDSMKSFYEKTLKNFFYLQYLFSNSMVDILDIQKNTYEIQSELLAYNQFINKNKYGDIFNYLEPLKLEVDKKIKKYTNTIYYDIIDMSFEKCSKFVNKNEELKNNYIMELKNFYENLKSLSGFFSSDKNIEKELNDELLIQKIFTGINNNQEAEIKKEENNKLRIDEKEINKINNLTNIIYAKIVENSNMISIFNYDEKTINNYNIFSEVSKDKNANYFRFNSNCFSLFDKDKNCIFISGGLKDLKDENSHDDSFYRLDIIQKPKSKYEFKLNKLCSMNNERSYHSMINLSSNKNIMLSISGINTESCEVYNIELDNWKLIQDLSMKFQSPGVIDCNKYIYVFPYTEEFNTIYRLNMKNNELNWESVKYSINEGNLKKGMAALNIDNNIFLLGGYDNKGNYSNVYEVDINNENIIDIKLDINLSLPSKIYFNSNFLRYKTNQNKNKDIILIMDNFNGMLEYNIESNSFEYYLEK